MKRVLPAISLTRFGPNLPKNWKNETSSKPFHVAYQIKGNFLLKQILIFFTLPCTQRKIIKIKSECESNFRNSYGKYLFSMIKAICSSLPGCLLLVSSKTVLNTHFKGFQIFSVNSIFLLKLSSKKTY